MTTCPKCRYTRQPSDTAPEFECPACGVIYTKAKPRLRRQSYSPIVTMKTVAISVFFMLGVAGLIYARHTVSTLRLPEPARMATATSPGSVSVENSPFDGSVRQVEKHLKSFLKDPDSFQAIQWFPVQKDLDGYTVRVRYKAKNSFGGYVVEDKVFLLDRRGNVIP